MPHRTLKFAIFGNTYQAKKSASIQKLLSHLDEYRAVIAVDQPYHEFLCHTLRLSLPHVEVIADDHFEADFAISMGGDSDTVAAIAGSLAEACWGVPDEYRKAARTYLDKPIKKILAEFEMSYSREYLHFY